jgi:hypothetical protein
MHAITPLHLRDAADASPPAMRRRLGRAVTQWSVTKAEWIKLRSVRVNVVGIANPGTLGEHDHRDPKYNLLSIK